MVIMLRVSADILAFLEYKEYDLKLLSGPPMAVLMSGRASLVADTPATLRA